ncbi:hypothetical protein HAX54_047310 [Datura stramonium]|uniref:Uncharacterized protein n=1 Tax=Datura stramonium TaxID=4076 RepID=A0ABS8WK33_DATST|nr:hypothetical protein [Datura stramonium]
MTVDAEPNHEGIHIEVLLRAEASNIAGVGTNSLEATPAELAPQGVVSSTTSPCTASTAPCKAIAALGAPSGMFLLTWENFTNIVVKDERENKLSIDPFVLPIFKVEELAEAKDGPSFQKTARQSKDQRRLNKTLKKLMVEDADRLYKRWSLNQMKNESLAELLTN